MKDRIKYVRKTVANMNQTKFGEIIGVKQGTVAAYESGDRTPIDAVVVAICREFDINETWLRTGEGQMQEDRTRRDEILGVMGKVAALPEGSPEFFMMGVLADMLSKIDSKYWGEIADKVVERAEAYKEAKKNETP